MALRKLAKDEDSGKHGCPTVYADDSATAEGEAVLVLQGDIVEVGDRWDAARVGPAGTRCVWTEEDSVLVQGDRLEGPRERELEDVLPGEAAVALLAKALFVEPRVGRAEDLGALRAGEVLLKIKARTVRAARSRYHEETS